jgi:hypothetical protein
MEPIFTMQYGEFAVADYLSKKIKASVFIPASAQEKGIDLLLYRYNNGKNETTTIQVKMSRTYYRKSSKNYPYYLWFNRFPIQDNANWYILVGIYAKHSSNVNAKAKSISWDTVMLAFNHDEMAVFMDLVKQKKDSTKPDKMFGFGFDDLKKIYQTRGCSKDKDMSCYLIENRLKDIQNSFN